MGLGLGEILNLTLTLALALTLALITLSYPNTFDQVGGRSASLTLTLILTLWP